MTNKEKIFERLSSDYKLLEEKGYTVYGVFLQGSQNYHLDYEESDIDTKAIVLPSFDDFVNLREPISTTIVLEDNSHLDVKDIRVMFNTFLKSNINFLEILFTEYYLINPEYSCSFKRIRKNNEDIAKYDLRRLLNGIYGMSLEKKKALTHPYPSLKEKIDKYGYDGKQLHHICRLDEFIYRLCVEKENFKNCLISRQPEKLVDMKKNKYSLEFALYLSEDSCDRIKRVKEDYFLLNELKTDTSIPIFLNVTKTAILKQHFRNEILK